MKRVIFKIKNALLCLVICGMFPLLLRGQEIIEEGTMDKAVTRLIMPREDMPAIDAYAVTLKKNPQMPLMIMIPGSKCYPLFMRKPATNRVLSTVMFYDALMDKPFDMNFIAVERRNLKSFQEYSTELISRKCSDSYGSVEKNDRVADAIFALKAIARQKWAGDIILAGHSEGADVVSGVAAALGDNNLKKLKVKAICFLSSGGSTQLFDHIVEARLTSKQTAQDVFEELLWLTGNPTGEYRGFPVRRYMSYAIETTPLEELKNLHTPIFIAHGTKDKNSPILSDDLLAAELFRTDKKRMLKYLILEGSDHGYNNAQGESRSADVLVNILKWISGGFPRQVETLPV